MREPVREFDRRNFMETLLTMPASLSDIFNFLFTAMCYDDEGDEVFLRAVQTTSAFDHQMNWMLGLVWRTHVGQKWTLPIHMREINGVRQRYQQSITRLKSYRRYFFSAFFFVELWVRSGGGVEVEKRDVFCVRWVKKLKTRWIFFQPEDILVKVLLVSNESKINNTE